MNQKITDNTLLDQPRLDRLECYAKSMATHPGEFAEVGVYKGGSAFLLADTMRATGNFRKLHLFDTFSGMPDKIHASDHHKVGKFADTSLEDVQQLLAEFLNVVLHVGSFPEDNKDIGGPFALVHLDCDLYESVKAGLQVFPPLMVPGGAIILDDVLAPDCPGAMAAALEYCLRTGKQMSERIGPSVVIKF